MLYEKNSAPLEVSSSIISSPKKYEYDTWIKVPAASENLITRARIKISKSFTGQLKSFFFKGEGFYLYYELENKQIYSYRIVPKNAEEGVWINPLILTPQTNANEPRVKNIKLVCLDKKMVSPEFEVEFEQIRLVKKGSATKDGVNIVNNCFNKDPEKPAEHLFFASNSTEEFVNREAIVKDRSTKKTDVTRLSKPLSYELGPGKSTERFTCKLDTGSIPENVHHIKFHLQAYVKTAKAADVFLIIEQDNTVKWFENLRYCTLQHHDLWHYAFFSHTEHINQLNLDRPFQFYILNPDSKEKIFVDNFSVTVDGLPY